MPKRRIFATILRRVVTHKNNKISLIVTEALNHRFNEVNKNCWTLEAINYYVAYIISSSSIGTTSRCGL